MGNSNSFCLSRRRAVSFDAVARRARGGRSERIGRNTGWPRSMRSKALLKGKGSHHNESFTTSPRKTPCRRKKTSLRGGGDEAQQGQGRGASAR